MENKPIRPVENRYDIYEPADGHFQRFRLKLEKHKSVSPKRIFLRQTLSLVAVAAILLLSIYLNNLPWEQWISPAENFDVPGENIADALKSRFSQIKTFDSPQSRKLIEDTFKQLNRLQADLEKLKSDFRRNNNRLILNAMRDNLNRQIQLLNELEKNLETTEKNARYEKSAHHS